MNKFWNHQTSESSHREDSLRLIPMWSIILAVVVFAGSMYFFNHAPPPHRRPGSMPMHLITSYITATALASYVLLAGYVSRDVKRRGMSAEKVFRAVGSSAILSSGWTSLSGPL